MTTNADLSPKMVVVVDDDVDMHNDSDVLWAMATRMQVHEALTCRATQWERSWIPPTTTA